MCMEYGALNGTRRCQQRTALNHVGERLSRLGPAGVHEGEEE